MEQDIIIEEPQDWTVSFPAYRRELFLRKIEKANNRLMRSGSDLRFEPVLEDFTSKRIVGGIELPDGTTAFGTEVEEPWVKATMPVVTLTIGNYTFVASLVREEAGYTVHCAPGQDLSTWKRPDVNDIHCDHCGTTRYRNRLYVVRDNESGELFQLGHSCIELYMGLKPKGLWGLQFDDELKAFADEDTGSGFGQRDYGLPVRKVLAFAFIFSDRGRSYVSKRLAEASYQPSTVSRVFEGLFPPKPPQRSHYRSGGFEKAMRDYEKLLADIAEANRVFTEETALIDDIISAAESVDSASDYGQNLTVILAGEHVSGRNVGILSSLVSVFARERELAIKRATAPTVASGFLADVKVRIKTPIRLTLKTVRHWEGDYGFTTLLVGYTEDMHCVVWKASGFHDYEPGDVLVLSAATVKAHEQYGNSNPIDQTVVTRAVVSEHIRATQDALV